MANKKTRVTYAGLNQDIAKSRVQSDMYFDAENIKLTPVKGSTFGTVSNSYGNVLALTVPVPFIDVATKSIIYGGKSLLYTSNEIDAIASTGLKQEIIGHIETTNGVILFTTDNTIDCIWEVLDLDQDELDVNLLYLRKLNFSTETPIQAEFNYENKLIQKIYWVDGVNFLRFLNTRQTVDNGYSLNLIDVPASSVNNKSTVDISRPTVKDSQGGGVHTAGMVQYAYTLYNLNNSETSLSPLSDLFPLDKGVGQGGGAVNEIVGSLPIVYIEDVDEGFEYLKLFSVKYTTFNGLPSISLVYDGKIGNYTSFTFTDTGTKVIDTLSIAEFLFLGADPIKPQHIVSKDNILFAANNTSTAYRVDIDTRAYSFNEIGQHADIFTNVIYSGVGNIPYTGTKWDIALQGYDVPKEFDCVNLNFDTFRFLDSGNTNTPGTPIVTEASYVENLVGIAPVPMSTIAAGNSTITFTASCGPENQSLLTKEYPITPTIGTGNKFVAQEAGTYKAIFGGLTDYTVTSPGRLIISSIIGYIKVYDTVGSATPSRILTMDKKVLAEFSIYSDLVDLLPGEAIEVGMYINYHYSNDTCPYQASDPSATYGYVGDGPYMGPDEVGESISTDYSFAYEGFIIDKVDVLEKNTLLPLTDVNSDGNIINGKFIADYSGTGDFSINSSVNMNGIAFLDTDDYKLSLLQNGTLIDSFELGLGSTGIVNQTFTKNSVSLVLGDIFELVLINNQSVVEGTAPVAEQDFNLTISGTLSVVSAVSAGSNGEGGSGKFINYELTRSDLDTVGLPLRQAKFFKDNEIYRIGVAFYNKIGQASEAKWIADFKAPQGNLEGQYNTLKITFNQAFYNHIASLPEEDRPTNYTILRAVRNPNDRTIISQGVMTGMFVQDYTKEYKTTNTYEKRGLRNSSLVKTPIPLTRGYGSGKSVSNSYYPIFPTKHNITMNESNSLEDPSRGQGDQDPGSDDRIRDEIYRDDSTDYKRHQSWQYTKMMQMYSPEATFHTQITTTDKDELHILGYMPRDKYQWWDFSINYQTFGPFLNFKSPEYSQGEDANFYKYVPSGFGVIGPTYRTYDNDPSRPEYASMDVDGPAIYSRRLHAYKSFLPLQRANVDRAYTILNRAEVAELGQGITSYNSDNSLQYINKLDMVVSDEKQESGSGSPSDMTAIKTVASENNRCLTMVLGEEGEDNETRIGLEDLYEELGTNEWDVELFGEIRKTADYVYSGALYNGYDYISRSRTTYYPIGDVNDIDIALTDIMSPGDTFVQKFINTRLTKMPGTIYDKGIMTIVETLEYLVESTINLEERNDSSTKSSWDAIVDPTSEEGNSYNNVYSTNSTIQTFSSDSTKIKDIVQNEVQIIASKVKIPGEFVDNWVDFRPNEVQHLDGKYGPITGIINHWDMVYAWQDFAVAQISINPRVQTQSDDGVTIELGTGRILNDYQYISTKSGCLNKWSIVSTNSGIFFFDANNKQLQRVEPQKGISGVSEAKGLHSFLRKNINRDIIRKDNPMLSQGVVAGYDIVNGDVYTTFLQDGNNYNISYNEKVNAYASFYSFIPTRYIVKGDRVFTVPEDNNTLWVHNTENYQSFYGTKKDSYITLIINTDTPGTAKVFNSIEFDSEVSIDDIDVPMSTIDSIEAWTTYQNSGVIPLVVGANIKRKFRTWKALIPRELGKRQRLRDKWIYLKLGFNPDNNEKLILYDITVNYSV